MNQTADDEFDAAIGRRCPKDITVRGGCLQKGVAVRPWKAIQPVIEAGYRDDAVNRGSAVAYGEDKMAQNRTGLGVPRRLTSASGKLLC